MNRHFDDHDFAAELRGDDYDNVMTGFEGYRLSPAGISDAARKTNLIVAVCLIGIGSVIIGCLTSPWWLPAAQTGGM